MDDPEHVEDAIFDDQVVHDPVVADTQPVEGVGSTPDRAHPLARDPARNGGVGRELLQTLPDPRLNRGGQLPVCPRGRRRKQNLVRLVQPSSRSGVERPLR